MPAIQLTSNSPATTEALAAQLGHNLKGGEVIALMSDLGGGKTTFVCGVAKGLGSTAQVSSPTFKIENVYHTNTLDIHHFDFYRLNEPGLIANELAESVGDPHSVTVIEWPDSVVNILPEDHVSIEIIQTGEEERSLSVHYPSKLAYLLEGIRV
jgi:tRNA threonylcarbamoyladenosine biosynthesis protein TsaE